MNKTLWEEKKQYKFNGNRLTSVNEIAPGVVVYEDVIPNSSNLYLDIEEGMTSCGLKWGIAGVYENNNAGINPESRDTLTIGVPYSREKSNDYSHPRAAFYSTLNNIFIENFNAYEDDYKHSYQVTTNWHDMWGILKYEVGNKFVNHIDDGVHAHRRISMIYYLNDNYSGGEITFPRFDITIKPKANQMIIFPSTYVYNHSVSPVTEGTRYSVVSWLK